MGISLKKTEVLKEDKLNEMAQEKNDVLTTETVKSPKYHRKDSGILEVLIVDDEETLLLSIDDGLSIYKQYFTLMTATNGVDAVNLLKSKMSIDLVITDLKMPRMDGFELLTYIQRNFPHIPVILMTAYGTPKIEEIVKTMGIYGYLEKPLDINTIAETIFEALKIKIH